SRPGTGHDGLVAEVRPARAVDQACPPLRTALRFGNGRSECGVHGVLLRRRAEHLGGRLGKLWIKVDHRLHHAPPALYIQNIYRHSPQRRVPAADRAGPVAAAVLSLLETSAVESRASAVPCLARG